MNDSSELLRKRSLKLLLKSCRDAMNPNDVGVAHRPRRRCRGVSQDEAAHLAGVTTRWWSGLENGWHSPHPATLDTVAAVLRMTAQQRADLYFLTLGHAPPSPGTALGVPERDEIELVHRAQEPALLTDHVGNVLASNTAAADWFPALVDGVASPENLAVWLFTPAAEERVENLNEIRALQLSQLKGAALRYPESTAVTNVVRQVVRLPDAVGIWNTACATVDLAMVRIRVRRRPGVIQELLVTTREFSTGNLLHIGFPPTASN
ncbi:helix-turn-helix domain-containing protein [Streptomycetaceae bacterium NBC_01309]